MSHLIPAGAQSEVRYAVYVEVLIAPDDEGDDAFSRGSPQYRQVVGQSYKLRQALIQLPSFEKSFH
jgi:hypothetical protein